MELINLDHKLACFISVVIVLNYYFYVFLKGKVTGNGIMRNQGRVRERAAEIFIC